VNKLSIVEKFIFSRHLPVVQLQISTLKFPWSSHAFQNKSHHFKFNIY